MVSTTRGSPNTPFTTRAPIPRTETWRGEPAAPKRSAAAGADCRRAATGPAVTSMPRWSRRASRTSKVSRLPGIVRQRHGDHVVVQVDDLPQQRRPLPAPHRRLAPAPGVRHRPRRRRAGHAEARERQPVLAGVAKVVAPQRAAPPFAFTARRAPGRPRRHYQKQRESQRGQIVRQLRHIGRVQHHHRIRAHGAGQPLQELGGRHAAGDARRVHEQRAVAPPRRCTCHRLHQRQPESRRVQRAQRKRLDTLPALLRLPLAKVHGARRAERRRARVGADAEHGARQGGRHASGQGRLAGAHGAVEQHARAAGQGLGDDCRIRR